MTIPYPLDTWHHNCRYDLKKDTHECDTGKVISLYDDCNRFAIYYSFTTKRNPKLNCVTLELDKIDYYEDSGRDDRVLEIESVEEIDKIIKTLEEAKKMIKQNG